MNLALELIWSFLYVADCIDPVQFVLNGRDWHGLRRCNYVVILPPFLDKVYSFFEENFEIHGVLSCITPLRGNLIQNCCMFSSTRVLKILCKKLSPMLATKGYYLWSLIKILSPSYKSNNQKFILWISVMARERSMHSSFNIYEILFWCVKLEDLRPVVHRENHNLLDYFAPPSLPWFCAFVFHW
jgi:hypothetical protein